MPHDSSREFDFGLDAEGIDYDPLADMGDEDEDDDSDGQQVPVPNQEVANAQAAKTAAKKDDQPASERIEELFKEMAPRRRVLLGILRFLQQPQSADALVGEVDRLQEYDYSVYTSANYAKLLERAGAIEKVNADGTPFSNDEEIQPEIVEVDGVEYLKPADGKPVYWANTAAGQEFLDSDKPLERLYELLADNKKYETIYKRILDACTVEGGLAIAEINKKVDKDPLVQKPRLYAPHFVDRLEKCDALRWEGKWMTTDIGKLGLERLADVVDTYVPEPDPEPEPAPEPETAAQPAAEAAAGAEADDKPADPPANEQSDTDNIGTDEDISVDTQGEE